MKYVLRKDLPAGIGYCSFCKEQKLKEEFSISKVRPSGLEAYCRVCTKEMRRLRKEADPNYARRAEVKHNYNLSWKEKEVSSHP